MKMHKNNAGLDAEKLAATFLAARGLILIAQNYHCRFGEIDLIMKEANTLVFIEVRLRSNANFGNAAMSITAQKQQKISIAAQHYLQQNAIEMPCRFDVIVMNKAELSAIEWIKNAFDAT
jgi:putative endonuclease